MREFSNTLINSSIYHLLNFDKYSDFPTAVRAAAESNDYQLVLLSIDLNPLLAIETQQKTSLERVVAAARENAIKVKPGLHEKINVDGVVTYWGVVTINAEPYYMLIADNKEQYSADEVEKLADIFRIAMGMWKYSPASDKRSDFIRALRRGNITKAYEQLTDLDLEGNEVVSVFAAKGPAPEEIIVAIDRYCISNGLINWQIIESNEIMGIIMSPQPKCHNTKVSNLFQELKSMENFKAVHFTGINSIEEACSAFKIVKEGIKTADKIYPYKRVFTKYDLALIGSCNSINRKNGHLKRLYLDLVSVFNEEKSQKGKQLLETLQTFVLDAGMNVTKTASIMNIHVNTVQYRLKKVNELLGVEVTGNRVVPGLTVSLALKRLNKA